MLHQSIFIIAHMVNTLSQVYFLNLATASKIYKQVIFQHYPRNQGHYGILYVIQGSLVDALQQRKCILLKLLSDLDRQIARQTVTSLALKRTMVLSDANQLHHHDARG